MMARAAAPSRTLNYRRKAPTMKVLIVDDDVTIVHAVRRGLEAEGFTVETAFDGLEGIWRATEFAYDAVILDIMLPKRNGFLVCADLRASGNWVPILMLTAKDGDLDEAEALDRGADDYLAKPFSFAVLVARLHALLRRSVVREEPLSLGDLRVDPRSRRVMVGGTTIVTTAREFDMLFYFALHPREVLSKRRILDGVWTDDFDGDPNIVEVYVGRLRRKLADRASSVTIDTMRGAGYLLTDEHSPASSSVVKTRRE